jgi:hypothetical protein
MFSPDLYRREHPEEFIACACGAVNYSVRPTLPPGESVFVGYLHLDCHSCKRRLIDWRPTAWERIASCHA